MICNINKKVLIKNSRYLGNVVILFLNVPQLSLLFRPLLVSFNNLVSTTSLEDLYRSTLLWIEQQCTLVDLRPSK